MLEHLLALLLWAIGMNPQFPLPHDIADAAKAITVAATKWGQVADQFNGGSVWAAVVLGLIIGGIIVKLWTLK